MQDSFDKFGYYKRLERLLEGEHNQQLLEEISQFGYLHSEESKLHSYREGKIQYVKDVYRMQEMRRDIFDERPVLYYTEQAVFAQISHMIVEISQLEIDLRIDNKILLGLKRQLQTLNQSEILQRQPFNYNQTMPFSQTLRDLQQEIIEMDDRINLIKLLDNGIEHKLNQAKQQHSQLQSQIINKTAILQEQKLLLNKKLTLQKQIDQTSQNIENPQPSLKQSISQEQADGISQMTVEILRQRIALQREVTEQQKEKEEFTHMLGQFQLKYKQTQHKNQQLKAQIEQGKRSAIFELMQV